MADITVQEGVWHHLAFTWDDVLGNYDFYIDGESVHSVSGAGGGAFPDLNDVRAAIGIGGVLSLTGVEAGNRGDIGDGGANFDGQLDDVTIYDRVLTTGELATAGRFGTFDGSPVDSGDPSAQTLAHGSSARITPAFLKCIIPFENDRTALNAAAPNYNDDIVENDAGASFHFRCVTDAAPNGSGGTTVVLDLTNSLDTAGSALSWSLDTTSNTTEWYKLFTPATANHELVRVASFSDPTVTLQDSLVLGFTDATTFFQRNLVADGDFESGEVAGSGSTTPWAKEGTCTLTNETTIVCQGVNACKIVSAGSGDGIKQTYNGSRTSTSGYASYSGVQFIVFASFYPSYTPGTGALISSGTAATPTGNYGFWGDNRTEAGVPLAATTWNHIEFVTDSIYKLAAQSIFLTNSDSGDGYYDNVHVLPSLCTDGKFETSIGGWTSAAGTLTNVGTAQSTAHSGTTHGKFTTSGSTSSLTYSMVMPFSNRYYLATIYVKMLSDGAASVATLSVVDTNSAEIATLARGLVASTNYTKISVLFASDNTGGPSAHDFKISFAGTSGDVHHVDDFYIVQLHNIPVVYEPMDEAHSVVPTRDQTGLMCHEGNVGLVLASMPMNDSEGGFLVRLRPQFSSEHNSSTPRTAFEWYGNTNNSMRLDYVSGKWVGVWRDGGVDRSLTPSTATTFAFDSLLEVSGWFDSEGRSIGGTTYYGKLFVNGDEVATLTTNINAQAVVDAIAYIGNNSDGDQSAMAVLDEIYLLTLAPTDFQCQGFYVDGEPLHNDNKAFTWNVEISSGDHIRIDTHTQTFDYYDEATRTRQALGATTGIPPSLKALASQKGWVLISDPIQEVRTQYRKEFL